MKHEDILLVGSVPLADAESVFRLLAEKLGKNARRYPDGETGERTNWIACQQRTFAAHPLLERSESPAGDRGEQRALLPSYRLRNQADSQRLHFERLGYADVASESFRTFRRLKSEGIIPASTRFQVSLPTALALCTAFVATEDRAAVEPAIEDALRREIEQIAARIPASDLAIQWDVAFEIIAHDGGWALHIRSELEEFVARICRHIAFVPQAAEAGIHLCYGDPGHKHIIEPKDAGTCVAFANAICARARRPIAWIHMPVPRDRTDDAFFKPLGRLELPPETEVYLGLIHLTDGASGAAKRISVAERFLPSFGVATECGLGRRDPATIPKLLELHAAVSQA